MVSHHPALQGLIASCTLLAMKGVVPSLLDFQQHLQQQITLYCQHLSKEGYPHEEVVAIQRLLCHVINSLAMSSFSAQGISWANYQLGPHYYGYQDGELFDITHSQLLLNSAHREIQSTAVIMYALSPLPLPGSENLPAKSPRAVLKETEVKEEVEEPPHLSVSASGPSIRWLSLTYQVTTAFFLLGVFWYGCRILQSGGL